MPLALPNHVGPTIHRRSCSWGATICITPSPMASMARAFLALLAHTSLLLPCGARSLPRHVAIQCSPAHPSDPYSPEYVEGGFSEVRRYEVLRSSPRKL